MSASVKSASALSVNRADVEDFLYHEAALLDDWQLEEWLGLFVEGARYLVPPAGSDDEVDPATTLFYVADDYFRLTERVKRLGKTTAHVEYPHSRCRHLVSNIRILSGTDSSFEVTSNFVTYRSKGRRTETYLGHHNYTLSIIDDHIRILKKISFLDTEDLNDQGKVSIII